VWGSLTSSSLRLAAACEVLMGWEYSEKTKQLFMNAVQGKPGTHLGEIDAPDGVGEHGSIACGDAMRFTFRVEKHPSDPLQDRIVEAKYLTFGCTSAIASSEALCSLIGEGGYTPIQALQITNEKIVDYLGGLPMQKIHCSVMGAEALEAAVVDWARKRGVDLAKLGIGIQSHQEEQEEGRLVCKCFNVTEPYLRRKIRELGLKTIEEVTAATKAGGACGSCHHAAGGIQDLLDEAWGRAPIPMPLTGSAEAPGSGNGSSPAGTQKAPAKGDGAVLSPYQFSKKIERVMEEYVRPMLQRDGGDVEILDIKDHVVYCQLAGACRACVGAEMTLKLMVERVLKDQVDERIRVISV